MIFGVLSWRDDGSIFSSLKAFEMDLPLQENSRSGQRPIVCSVVMGYIHSMTPQLLVTNGGPGTHGENRPRYVLSSPQSP